MTDKLALIVAEEKMLGPGERLEHVLSGVTHNHPWNRHLLYVIAYYVYNRWQFRERKARRDSPLSMI